MWEGFLALSVARLVNLSRDVLAIEDGGEDDSSANSFKITAMRRFKSRNLPSITTKMKKSDTGAPRMAAAGSSASNHSPVSKMKMVIIAGPQ